MENLEKRVKYEKKVSEMGFLKCCAYVMTPYVGQKLALSLYKEESKSTKIFATGLITTGQLVIWSGIWFSAHALYSIANQSGF